MSIADRLPAAPSFLARRTPRRVTGTGRQRAAALFGVAAVTGTAFVAAAIASARYDTVEADNELHAQMREGLQRSAGGDAAAAVAPAAGPVGKWWVYAPVALAAAAAVLAAPGLTRKTRRGRRAGAAAIAVVPALVTALGPAFDKWLPQPPVGPRRRPVDHPVFPSGHAFRTAAVSLTTGYVVAREALARPAVAWPIAAVAPVAVGVGRLVQEKHLASDVVGGWLVGTAIAAATAGAYELARAPERPARRGRRRFG